MIEVERNTTLTLTSPFGTASNGFAKGDFGTLILSASNASWGGAVNVNAGALRITNSSALGLPSAGTTVTNLISAALQLEGVNIFEPITINGTGINTNGSLESYFDANAPLVTTSTVNGVVTLASAAAIGADTGTTLNLRGGITGLFGLTFVGGGNINIDTAPLSGSITSISKLNAGTTTLAVNSTGFVGTITVSSGTFAIGGQPGGAGSIGGTGLISLNTGGALSVDDSVGLAIANRLGGGRAMTFQGGSFSYTGNSTGPSTESVGIITIGRGGSTITITAGAGSSADVVATSLLRGVGGTLVMNDLGTGPLSGELTLLTAPVFIGQAGITGTVSKGILPWLIVTDAGGTGFGTTDSSGVFQIRRLSASEQSTPLIGNANVALSGSVATPPGSMSVNSLVLNSGAGITNLGGQTFTISSGGLLANMGNASIYQRWLSERGHRGHPRRLPDCLYASGTPRPSRSTARSSAAP